MAWTAPITDRTALDVTNRESKAFFNVVDFTRLYDNIVEAHGLVEAALSITIPIVWYPVLYPTMPTTQNICLVTNALIDNIEYIRTALLENNIDLGLAVLPRYVSGINNPSPNYAAVNAWENNLLLIYEWVTA